MLIALTWGEAATFNTWRPYKKSQPALNSLDTVYWICKCGADYQAEAYDIHRAATYIIHCPCNCIYKVTREGRVWIG